MTKYFLGADVGATKTHVMIADETGRVLGLGRAGPGNHEVVGYAGLAAALQTAAGEAFKQSAISKDRIAAAGFGLAGFDWPSEEEPHLVAVRGLGLPVPFQAVNDTLLGLLAGAEEGWGVSVVSGTGCNCWGWDRTRKQVAQMTGGGSRFGEGAGAIELVEKALTMVALEWTGRGPATSISSALVNHVGARDVAAMLQGLMDGTYAIGADAAPLVFAAALGGDAVALELVRWAGKELGDMAAAIIRQLHFESLSFDVVMVGGMFDGHPLLSDLMRQKIIAIAPRAHTVRLTTLPVVGAVILAMEQTGQSSPGVLHALRQSVAEYLSKRGI
jgi:N-acetylglucosamine kinase-like BadF-type ATPase